MQNLISVIPDKCTGCGACIRSCPAPEANFYTTSDDGRKIVQVNDDKCIVCGKCLHECKHDARDFEDDTTKFFKDIANKRVVLIVSPAIRAAFPDKWVEMLKWLKQEGVFALYDMALGGDICSWANLRAVETNKMKYALSSHCPAVVNYITTYRHDLVSDLSPVYSPAACMAVYIRTYLKVNYSIGVLTSCVGTKTDMGDSNLIEYNVTFKRFEEELIRRKVNLGRSASSSDTYSFEDETGALGTILIRPSGLRDNIWSREPEVNLSSASGKEVLKYISEFGASPKHAHPVLTDCIACEEGCALGPGMDWDVSYFAVQDILHQQELDARSRRKTGIMNGPDKQYKKFDEIFNVKSFMRDHKERGGARNEITSEALNAAYLKMGKTTDKEKSFNCGACGCSTCREMAEKIALGGDIPENCLIYARSSSGGSVDNSAVNKKMTQMTVVAEKVRAYADHLLADIENIYASLYNIDDANHQSQSRSTIVRDILSKIVGFCNSCDSIDSDNLPILVSTLEKLQTAMDSLNSLIDDSVSNSTTIREAMKEVADATTELNVMVCELIEEPSKESAV